MPSTPAAIQLKDIHKSYGSLEVLKGVSLDAHNGEVISIIGSSGSGKSTLLRCINLLEQPSQGEIIINDQPLELKVGKGGDLEAVDKRQIQDMRQKLGFVFQNFNLWPHMTVLENIIEGPTLILKQDRAEAIEKARVLMDKVGLSDKADFYPSMLSGGQQQRVSIARALAMEPDALLFDEPTSALDPELVSEVLKVIRALADEGRTMLIVTHEMGFAREVSNKVMFLHEGKVEEFGTPEQVFDNPTSQRCREFLSSVL
ncbi:ATP-binding cassette domain-containing protein [uncultured Endozoicomonas sp.]|uniref:ABC transporter ATP-binding protein n=1 Tax=uncultured Endozoicomonas sp. TaxID=432652 RepID=UPI002632CAB3|nr:ATP-binding cassette domain-containing protein [uncultured Endozoicomonas sp.]